MWYTKKGDDGTSKIFGAIVRVSKSDLIFEALGNIDELNSWIGFVRSFINKNKTKKMKKELLEIQHDLFTIQAELAGSQKSLPKNRVLWLEKKINDYEKNCPIPKGFVVSGATKESAFFDISRAIARRSERSVVRLQVKTKNKISSGVLSYLNRLSSYLYICARYLALKSKAEESQPKYR